MKKLILLLSVLGMLSCTHNTGLERTFHRAGENRAELEKVLRHYEGDERKHRAASSCWSVWRTATVMTMPALTR